MLKGVSAGFLMVLAGCASGGNAAPEVTSAGSPAKVVSERCAPTDTLVSGMAVYPECGVGITAKPLGSAPRIQYTPRGRTCSMTDVVVVVDAEGRVLEKTARVVRTNDPELTTAYLAVLPTMRFTPASKDGKHVAQLVQVGTMAVTETRRAGAPVASTRGMRPRC